MPAKAPDPQHYVNLKDLRLWPDNYNEGDIGLISGSINRHGFRGAIRVWQENMVIANNHVTMALMGIKADGPRDGVPWPPKCVVVHEGDWYVRYVDCSDMTYVEAKAFAIADNEIARKSVRDETKLAALLTEIYQADAGLGASTGIDGDELDTLLSSLASNAPLPTRESFDKLVDEFTNEAGKSEKDGNWFYIEFYGDDERFEALKEAIGDALMTGHQLDPDYFWNLVMKEGD